MVRLHEERLPQRCTKGAVLLVIFMHILSWYRKRKNETLSLLSSRSIGKTTTTWILSGIYCIRCALNLCKLQKAFDSHANFQGFIGCELGQGSASTNVADSENIPEENEFAVWVQGNNTSIL